MESKHRLKCGTLIPLSFIGGFEPQFKNHPQRGTPWLLERKPMVQPTRVYYSKSVASPALSSLLPKRCEVDSELTDWSFLIRLHQNPR